MPKSMGMATGCNTQIRTSLGDTLIEDHHRCDALLVSASQYAAHGDWAPALHAMGAFVEAMNRHIGFEEEVLFPVLEQRIGAGGPTQVMRMEHDRMRALFLDLLQGVQAQDAPRLHAVIVGLTTLIQQHNMKEESILYRMTDRMLGAQGPLLAARFRHT